MRGKFAENVEKVGDCGKVVGRKMVGRGLCREDGCGKIMIWLER